MCDGQVFLCEGLQSQQVMMPSVFKSVQILNVVWCIDQTAESITFLSGIVHPKLKLLQSEKLYNHTDYSVIS